MRYVGQKISPFQLLSDLCELGIITVVCRGFKDARTVELLLQRAQKLEHSFAQKKKFSQLGRLRHCVICFDGLQYIALML